MRVHIISQKIWAKLGGQSRWVVLNTHPHPHTSSLFDAMMMTTTMLIEKMSKMHKSKHISMHRWYNKATPAPIICQIYEYAFCDYVLWYVSVSKYIIWAFISNFSTYIEMRTNAVFIVNVLLFCMLLDHCTFNAKPLSKCRYFFFSPANLNLIFSFSSHCKTKRKTLQKKKHDRK